MQPRIQARTRKNATKLANEYIAHECGVLQIVERQNYSCQINLSKTPNSNDRMATDYKGSRNMHVPLGCNPNGLDTIQGPKAKNESTKTDSGHLIISIIPITFR
jgi:hypothetical protein